jgi:hypothetical protein
VFAATTAFAPGARAHPAPAEPPAFFSDPCIVTIDRRQAPDWHLAYANPVEDTAHDPDLIALPDTKSHEFFAVAGHVFERAMGYAVVPFDDADGVAQPLPLWLSDADLMRAREAGADHPAALADLPRDAASLESELELASLFQPFGHEPRRVAITPDQGALGVTWKVGDAPDGVYQVVAYIFSPPYNGWAPRPGLLRLVDGPDDTPALWLDGVSARLFGGQGKRVTGCAHAPDGSRLQLRARPAGDPEGRYEVWIDDVPIIDARFDACLINPGRDASLTLQAVLTTPSGAMAAVTSVGTVDMFSAAAPCQPGATACCDGATEADPSTPATTPDASLGDAGLGDTGADAEAPRPTVTGGGGASALADASVSSGSVPHTDGDEAESDRSAGEPAAAASGFGCGVIGRRGDAARRPMLPLGLLLFAVAARPRGPRRGGL